MRGTIRPIVLVRDEVRTRYDMVKVVKTCKCISEQSIHRVVVVRSPLGGTDTTHYNPWEWPSCFGETPQSRQPPARTSARTSELHHRHHGLPTQDHPFAASSRVEGVVAAVAIHRRCQVWDVQGQRPVRLNYFLTFRTCRTHDVSRFGNRYFENLNPEEEIPGVYP